MHPALAHQRQAKIEVAHQEALSPPHPAPEIDAPRQRRMDHPPPQRVRALRLGVGPLLVELLQPLHRPQLRGIALEPAPLERAVIELDRPVSREPPAFARLPGAPPHRQLLRARLSTASAASFMSSESEGWAWQIMPMSSLLARNSMATTASAISSEANAPMMCTPSIASVLASATNFTRPLVSPSARARALAMNGKLPAR